METFVYHPAIVSKNRVYAETCFSTRFLEIGLHVTLFYARAHTHKHRNRRWITHTKLTY
jgi:hypothetical protein